VAEEQRQFPQAHAYYQQALAIRIEFNDRYAQAGTYHQLGNVAREQQQFEAAQDYYLQALQLFAEYNDNYSLNITLENLNILYHQQPDPELAGQIAAILNCSAAEALAILQQDLED
jgi:tetratricopeptide (TPR) repeat protein